MSKFGKVDKSETSFEEYKLYKNQTLTSASNGVSLIHTREGQVQSDEIEAALTVSGRERQPLLPRKARGPGPKPPVLSSERKQTGDFAPAT